MILTLTYDEQIQKLQAICNEKCVLFLYHDKGLQAHTENGAEISKDLLDKWTVVEKEFQKTVFDYNTLLAFCHNNNIDLTEHFKRLGVK